MAKEYWDNRFKEWKSWMNLGSNEIDFPWNDWNYPNDVLKKEDWNWKFCNYHTDKINKTAIVVLRDPVDRWISGFATYASSWILGPGYGSDHFRDDYNQLTERFIFDQIVFDDHTTEQVQYLMQLPNVPVTYFKLNHELGTNLEKFIDLPLGLNNPIPSNISEDNYDTKMIAEHMRHRINQDPVLHAKIINRYQADYELIRSANYYHHDPR
jgi:hypothetical protein